MNKLIKRFFYPPLLCMHFSPSTLEIILSKSKSKKEREKEKGRKEERKKTIEWDTECLRMQKYNRGEEKKEWSRLERRKNQMSSWNDVLHSPRLRIPKYLVLEMWKPGARRTPFPREAPLVSLARETAGSSGVQTSAKRQAREICMHWASFFPSPGFSPPFFLTLFPPSSSFFFAFFLSLCCVSDATPLFYQINISQNKRQDNFKLAREERRGKKRGEMWKTERENLVQFARFLWSFQSVFPLFTFWGLWFLSSLSWSQLHRTDEVVTTPYECRMKEHREHLLLVGDNFCIRVCQISTNPPRPGQSIDSFLDCFCTKPAYASLGFNYIY